MVCYCNQISLNDWHEEIITIRKTCWVRDTRIIMMIITTQVSLSRSRYWRNQCVHIVMTKQGYLWIFITTTMNECRHWASNCSSEKVSNKDQEIYIFMRCALCLGLYIGLETTLASISPRIYLCKMTRTFSHQNHIETFASNYDFCTLVKAKYWFR